MSNWKAVYVQLLLHNTVHVVTENRVSQKVRCSILIIWYIQLSSSCLCSFNPICQIQLKLWTRESRWVKLDYDKIRLNLNQSFYHLSPVWPNIYSQFHNFSFINFDMGCCWNIPHNYRKVVFYIIWKFYKVVYCHCFFLRHPSNTYP